jgi:RNA polymerase sigma factor (sigma-70 family)
MKLLFRKENQPTTYHLSDMPGEDLDVELARQISEGSQEALARFVDRHVGYLYKHLQRRLGPGHDALIETVVKATFASAFRRMRPYARGSARTPMRLWMLRLAGRELSRHRKSISPGRGVSGGTVESEELSALREVIASLPPRQQAAMFMALFEGMSAEEVAGALGVRQARAMRLLRNGLRRTGVKLSLAHAEVS